MPITPITPSGSNAPNDLPSDAAGAVAVPNTLPSDAAGAVNTPNTLSADAAGAVAVPNTLPADGAGSVASPVSLPSVAAAAAPRTLTPMVNLDFAAKSYARKGRTVLFDDLLTYTRPSSATFINRRPDVDGGYEYFLDTDYVGDVTNLATYSEDFSDADWLKSSGASVTANATESPLGEINADLVTVIGASYVYRTVSVTASNNYTFSIWLKSADNAGGTYPFRVYNGSTFVGEAVTLTSDWKRHTVSFTAATATAIVYIADGRVSATAETVYAWGAQVTESAKPLPYVKTLASAVTQTFTETLRVEYDVTTGENLGALIEGGSTNLATYSEDFSNAAWIKGDSTILSNEIVAPDDTFSVDKINAATSASIAPRVSQTITANISSTYTISYYVKKAEASIVQIYFGGSDVANNPRVNFNLITGSVGSQDNDIVSATINPIKNDIYRITATVVAAVATGFTAGIVAIKSTTDTRAQANAWTIGDGVYVWGAQFEELPFASSYIRTEGAAVSRSDDKLSLPSTSALKENNFTIRTKFSVLHLNDPTPISYVAAHEGLNPPSGSSLRVFTYGLGILSRLGTNSSLNSGFDSIANIEDDYVTTYLDNTIRTYDNGVAGATTSGQGVYAPNFNNPLIIGANKGGNGEFLNGHISKLKTYAQALTAQEITLL